MIVWNYGGWRGTLEENVQLTVMNASERTRNRRETYPLDLGSGNSSIFPAIALSGQ